MIGVAVTQTQGAEIMDHHAPPKALVQVGTIYEKPNEPFRDGIGVLDWPQFSVRLRISGEPELTTMIAMAIRQHRLMIEVLEHPVSPYSEKDDPVPLSLPESEDANIAFLATQDELIKTIDSEPMQSKIVREAFLVKLENFCTWCRAYGPFNEVK